jgi:hypothetical protein
VDFAARMESSPFMSRAHDTAVDSLLGCILVAVFLLPFLLYVVVAGYVLHALNLGVQYFFPGMANPVLMIVGFFFVLSLVSAVRHAWKRRWQSAFLSFAMLAVIASMLLADTHSPLGLRAPFWMFGLFPMFAIPEGSGPTRSQFFLAASTICAVIAINTGLLGWGPVARIMTDCILAGLVIWFVIDVRQRSSGTKNPGPKAPLSPTHA